MAAETAEYLILIALDEEDVGPAVPIEDRFKDEIDVPALGDDPPGAEEVVLLPFFGDFETDVIQFICFFVDEQHIFARGARIAEAISQVPTDLMTVLEAT